jgi:hypothetical protein
VSLAVHSGNGAWFVRVLQAPAELAAASPNEWERLLRLARASNLLGKVALQVQGTLPRAAVPAAVAPHLVAAQRLAEHQQTAVERECRHLEAALSRLDAPVLLLKGAAYAMTRRRAARGRLFGDVDLLVPREALGAAEAALMLHGWTVGAIDPYDSRYYRQWMHELPPMTNLRRGTVVDVHHNILPLTARRVPDARALLNESAEVAGSRFRVLSPRDMVIHSAVHLFHEGELKNGLRDLLDLVALIEEFSSAQPAFLDSLLQRAAQLNLAWPVALALRYCRAVAGLALPRVTCEQALQLAGIGPLSRAFFDAMYLRAFMPDHELAATPGSQVARAAIYVRSHALRMPVPRLALHLGRKLVLRAVKHTSRSVA